MNTCHMNLDISNSYLIDVSFLVSLLWLGFLLQSFSIQIEQGSMAAEVEVVCICML